ncbi:MAG: carboxypeptidase-like regulatory domain-containing protein [Planctomycetota bacterium]|nr:carboxypeptidase-like regulatory domain-containing protein [Planctomycetota bacterium]
MKSWPLILVFLLLGVCALIVLTPAEQATIDNPSAPAEGIAATSTLGEPAANSTHGIKAADAINRTNVEAGTSEASLDPSAANRLFFDRPPAILKMRLVDGDGKGVPDAGIRVNLDRQAPGIDWKEWYENNLLHTDLDGKLWIDVPSNIGLRLNIEGSEWHEVDRRIQALAVNEQVDLGEIALAPANHLTGHVFDPEGNPVAGASVALEEASGSMWGNFGTNAVKSNEEGVYSFSGVRRGRYEINVNAPGFAPLKLDSQELDQNRGVFELDLELEYGDSTRGLVVDDEGNIVPNAHVYLVHFDSNDYWGEYQPPLPNEDSEILSDQDGRFQISGISDTSSMTLGAKAEGYGSGYAEEVKANGDALIKLPRHFIVRGTVHDSEGNPVVKAHLAISSLNPENKGDHNTFAYTKEDGSFAFSPLAPGSWELSLSSSLGSLDKQPLQLNADFEPLSLELPVEHPLNILVSDGDGNPLPGVTVNLKKPRQEDSMNSMEHRLRSMELTFSSANFSTSMGDRNATRAKTDEHGIAHFADLDPEQYQLSLELLGFATLEEDLHVTGAAQEESFTMDDSAYLKVRLVNSNGDPVTHVQVGLRTAESGEDLEQKQTDDAGRAVWNNLKEGDYQVSYRANDADGWWWDSEEEEEHAADQETVSVKAGETKDFELVINDLALVTVIVTRHGAPAADVKVQLQEVNPDRNHWSNDNDDGNPTDGRGSIDLPAVKAGTYDIVIKGRKASPATKERVELYVGPQTIDVALDGSELRGALMGTHGPLARATVALVPYFDAADGDKPQSNQEISIMGVSMGDGKPVIKVGKQGENDTNTRSNSKGTYTFLDVPDGQWTIIARSDGYGTWTSKPISVQDGQNVDLGSNRLFPGGEITGHDDNWVPPSPEEADNNWFGWGNQITLLDGKGETVSMAILDERGDFLFGDLPEGSYVIKTNKYKSEVIQLSPGGRIDRDIPLEQPEEEKESDKEQ